MVSGYAVVALCSLVFMVVGMCWSIGKVSKSRRCRFDGGVMFMTAGTSARLGTCDESQLEYPEL